MKKLPDIVLASNNRNKLREISHILGRSGFKVMSLKEAGIRAEIPETGETLKENARMKAAFVRARVKNGIIISDDTGLEVLYLAMAPGVYSARFAGEGCTYLDNNKKLLKLMKGVPKKERGAVFRTVIYIIYPDGKEEHYEGRVNGIIHTKMKGANGFGYDPVFYFPPINKTFAEMSPEEKNRVSHRKKAVAGALKLILGKHRKIRRKKK